MTHSTSVILRDLGDGLIMRRSTPADADALAEFNKMIHRDEDVVEPDETVAAWTRDLLTRDHPTFGAGDFTIVEDTRDRQNRFVAEHDLANLVLRRHPIRRGPA